MNATKYLTQQQASETLHISPRTLERMRVEGTGPRFRKAGRRVLYLQADIDSWLESRGFFSTSEAQAAEREMP